MSGCRQREKAPELVALEGKVEKIERASNDTGAITVVYYNEKQKQEMTGTAQVTPETEIMIDGAAATLANVLEGDRVRGEVRIEKKSGERLLTVVRIQIERPKSGG